MDTPVCKCYMYDHHRIRWTHECHMSCVWYHTGTVAVAVQINMPRQWFLVAEILYTCSDCNCKNDHRHQAEVNRREAQRRGSDLDIDGASVGARSWTGASVGARSWTGASVGARSRTGAAAGNRAGHLLRLTIPASTKSIIKPVHVLLKITTTLSTTHLCPICSVLVVKLVKAFHGQGSACTLFVVKEVHDAVPRGRVATSLYPVCCACLIWVGQVQIIITPSWTGNYGPLCRSSTILVVPPLLPHPSSQVGVGHRVRDNGGIAHPVGC